MSATIRAYTTALIGGVTPEDFRITVHPDSASEDTRVQVTLGEAHTVHITFFAPSLDAVRAFGRALSEAAAMFRSPDEGQ